jgi:hypothetical protein
MKNVVLIWTQDILDAQCDSVIQMTKCLPAQIRKGKFKNMQMWIVRSHLIRRREPYMAAKLSIWIRVSTLSMTIWAKANTTPNLSKRLKQLRETSEVAVKHK